MYKQINYLARKMSSVRTQRVCFSQWSPLKGWVYGALDEIIERIYRNEVNSNQISMVSNQLQKIELWMVKVKKKIIDSLFSASCKYQRIINKAEKQIMKKKKQMAEFLMMTKKWVRKGENPPIVDENSFKLQLAFKIYENYLHLSIANKKSALLWRILEEKGIFSPNCQQNPRLEVLQIQLDHIALLTLISKSKLLGIENFGTILLQLCESLPYRQKQSLLQMLNAYKWEKNQFQKELTGEKSNNSDSSRNKKQSETQETQDIFQFNENNSQKCLFFQNMLSMCENNFECMGLEEQNISDHPLFSNQFVQQARNLFLQSFKLIKELDQQKQTEDESRPTSEQKKKTKKKRKNKKNKTKKKQEVQQQKQSVKIKQNGEQFIKEAVNRPKLIRGNSIQHKQITTKKQRRKTSVTHKQKEKKYEKHTDKVGINEKIKPEETITMLKDLFVDEKKRSKCTAIPDSVDWWKSKIQK